MIDNSFWFGVFILNFLLPFPFDKPAETEQILVSILHNMTFIYGNKVLIRNTLKAYQLFKNLFFPVVLLCHQNMSALVAQHIL